MRTARRSRKAEGSASVLLLAVIGALLAVAAVLLPVCAALASRQAAAGAADAAALAAADTASGLVPGVPCDAAARAAEVNGAHVDACEVSVSADGAFAAVTASVGVLGLRVSATARAGPPPEP